MAQARRTTGKDVPRLFTATFGTETNSFSPVPTGMTAFANTMLWRPGEHPAFATEATAPLWVARQQAKAGTLDLVEGTCAFAMPGGPVVADAYRAIRDEILEQLKRAMPVDIVAFGLHGAMLSFGEDECEADLLERARSIVGPSVPIGAELDLHAHVSARMVRAADVLVAFKEYPHTDYLDRARELIAVLRRKYAHTVRPVPALFDCRMVGGMTTNRPEMRALVDELKALEAAGTILSGSIIHGFKPGDVARLGAKVLIYTDGDAPLAARIAADFGRRFRRIVLAQPHDGPGARSLDDDLAQARAASVWPVILVEGYDSPGGGAAGDNMRLARALIDHAMAPACVGPIWDPQAVRFCFEAGLGATLDLRIGGKTGVASGEPLDVHGTVVGLAHDVKQHLLGALPPLGDVAAIKVGELCLVVTEIRDQCYGSEMFQAVGIDPAKLRYLAIKGGVQSHIGFGDRPATVIPVSAPALAAPRIYRKRPRPIWPFEAAELSEPA